MQYVNTNLDHMQVPALEVLARPQEGHKHSSGTVSVQDGSSPWPEEDLGHQY